MKILKEHYVVHKLNGTIIEFDVIHMFSETGMFYDMADKPCGWHIELGTDDSVENYTEVYGSEHRVVPDSLPDIIIYERMEELND